MKIRLLKIEPARLQAEDPRKKTIEPGTRQGGDARREWLGLALLLAAGLLPRLAFVTAFPTRPVSDFRGLVDFGLALRDHRAIAGGFYYWDFLNPGLPLTLSLILRLFPAWPDSAARLATAIATGLMPLLPYRLWRGVQPRWVRLLAGGMLALWPGQIGFSGVVGLWGIGFFAPRLIRGVFDQTFNEEGRRLGQTGH